MSIKEKEKLIELLEQQINDTVYATEQNPFKKLEYNRALGIFLANTIRDIDINNIEARNTALEYGPMLVELEKKWDWLQSLE